MPGALLAAGGGAAVVAAIHYVAHRTTGEERYFDEAGVMWAGVAITGATFAVIWAVASRSAPAATLGVDGVLGNPVWAALLGLVAFMLLVLVMNKGRWWFLNFLAQKEPAAAAIGVALVIWGGGPPLAMGVSVVAAGGALLVALAFVARYTERLDF